MPVVSMQDFVEQKSIQMLLTNASLLIAVIALVATGTDWYCHVGDAHFTQSALNVPEIIFMSMSLNSTKYYNHRVTFKPRKMGSQRSRRACNLQAPEVCTQSRSPEAYRIAVTTTTLDFHRNSVYEEYPDKDRRCER